jgi:hypothetical protein
MYSVNNVILLLGLFACLVNVDAFAPTNGSTVKLSNFYRLERQHKQHPIDGQCHQRRQKPLYLSSMNKFAWILNPGGEEGLTTEKIGVILELTFIQACFQLATG